MTNRNLNRKPFLFLQACLAKMFHLLEFNVRNKHSVTKPQMKYNNAAHCITNDSASRLGPYRA